MTKYIDENGDTVTAKNFQEAAERLYGQAFYIIEGNVYEHKTTYALRFRSYADVHVYEKGDRQGTHGAHTQKHVLKVLK